MSSKLKGLAKGGIGVAKTVLKKPTVEEGGKIHPKEPRTRTDVYGADTINHTYRIGEADPANHTYQVAGNAPTEIIMNHQVEITDNRVPYSPPMPHQQYNLGMQSTPPAPTQQYTFGVDSDYVHRPNVGVNEFKHNDGYTGMPKSVYHNPAVDSEFVHHPGVQTPNAYSGTPVVHHPVSPAWNSPYAGMPNGVNNSPSPMARQAPAPAVNLMKSPIIPAGQDEDLVHESIVQPDGTVKVVVVRKKRRVRKEPERKEAHKDAARQMGSSPEYPEPIRTLNLTGAGF